MALTKAPYLNDTYLFTHTSEVADLGRDDHGDYATFGSSIFYPQGGGQPSDRGQFSCEGHSYQVFAVRSQEHEVRHYYHATAGHNACPVQGSMATMQIDQESRLWHARLHSAGHVLAHLVETQWPGSEAVKGHHFPGEAYIEALMDPDTVFDEQVFVDALNAQLAQYIESNSATTIAALLPSALAAAKVKIPAFLQESSEPIRTVAFGSFAPSICGGTHIGSANELQGCRVTKAKFKKGRLKVSYLCSQKET